MTLAEKERSNANIQKSHDDRAQFWRFSTRRWWSLSLEPNVQLLRKAGYKAGYYLHAKYRGFGAQDVSSKFVNPDARFSGTVVVLEGGSTSLAVVRCLAKASMKTIVVGFESSDICKSSRLCDFIRHPAGKLYDEKFSEWLTDHFQSLPGFAVLIPTSDAATLFVSQYRKRLQARFLTWHNTLGALHSIVSKDELYSIASRNDIPVPNFIVAPTYDQLREWTSDHEGPYIVKPFYVSEPNAPFSEKNLAIKTADELLRVHDQLRPSSVIIQQRLKGGDGNIYDCYGLCNSFGRVVLFATHLRIRQSACGAGVTSYGEIPALNPPFPSEAIIRNTSVLFEHFNYHGIFGVEWLWDIKSETLQLIDVNARPFSSIGHLCDSGMNLPAEAVRELAQRSFLPSGGKLRHTYWMDFSRDIRSAFKHIESGDLTLRRWLRDLMRARSFAYWRISDPAPAIIAFGQLTARLFKPTLARIARNFASRRLRR